MARSAGAATFGNKATPAKPRARADKITRLLTQIEQAGDIPPELVRAPGEFLREFYDAWVENGGQEGGKNRNSIRRMRLDWLTGPREVKSLHPKLSGRVKITRDDAAALIELFLGRWQFGAKGKGRGLTEDGYRPFPCRQPARLREQLLAALFPSNQSQALLLPPRLEELAAGQAQSDFNTIFTLYEQADAVIVLSRHQSSVGASRIEAMRAFWNYLKYLHDYFHDHAIMFIWVVDIGSREVEDDEAWREFSNFEHLKSQFRSFASFDSVLDRLEDGTAEATSSSAIHDAFLRGLKIPEEGRRERRWKWLCARSVVVVQNLRHDEFDRLYADEDDYARKVRTKDIGVSAEYVLPSTLPYAFGRQKAFYDLYGRSVESMADATLSVLFRKDGWRAPTGPDDLQDVRYFAAAAVPGDHRQEPREWSSTLRWAELESPGAVYDEAQRIVYWAARHRLRKLAGEHAPDSQDWAIALAYLARLGFRVLRLPEFLRTDRLAGDPSSPLD